MQALEPSNLNNVVLQTPLLSLKWDYAVDVLEQSRDCVCCRARRVGNGPKDVRRWQVVPLNGESNTHRGQPVCISACCLVAGEISRGLKQAEIIMLAAWTIYHVTWRYDLFYIWLVYRMPRFPAPDALSAHRCPSLFVHNLLCYSAL